MKKRIIIFSIVLVTILSGMTLMSQYRKMRVEKFLNEKRSVVRKHEQHIEAFLKKQKELIDWQNVELKKLEKMLTDMKAQTEVVKDRTADFFAKFQDQGFFVKTALQTADEAAQRYAEEEFVPKVNKIKAKYKNTFFLEDRSNEEILKLMPAFIREIFVVTEPFYVKAGEALMAEVEYNLERQKQYLGLLKELTGIDFLEWEKSQGLL